MKNLYSEDDLLPLSALAHLVFCERRAALNHLEGLWEDNLFTAEGTVLHHKSDEQPEIESRGEVRIARRLRLRSLRLGLSGIADVVEFRGKVPIPIEYKRGRLHHEQGYEVQLCAQAFCLEEMLDVSVPTGAIFFGKTARRLEVTFDDALRTETKTAAARLHRLIADKKTPVARYEKKCESCSIRSLCLPKALNKRGGARGYLIREIRDADRNEKIVKA